MTLNSPELLSRHLKAGKALKGVVLRALNRNIDSRGEFTEIFCGSWSDSIEAMQWSLVSSKAGVLRGMHLHQRHDEYLLCTAGRICIGLRDLRPGSTTKNTSCLLEVAGEDAVSITIPRGILHGWYFHENSVHIQSVSEEHSSYHPDDNIGCRWDDPALEIPWPESSVVLSDRASDFPDLETLLQKM